MQLPTNDCFRCCISGFLLQAVYAVQMLNIFKFKQLQLFFIEMIC